MEHGDAYICHFLGRVHSTMEDVSMMFCLPIFAGESTTGLFMSEEEERRL